MNRKDIFKASLEKGFSEKINAILLKEERLFEYYLRQLDLL
jgi:hypothetical protein